MEHIKKLRLPNSFKVIEFKYPIQKFVNFTNTTSDYSDLSSIYTENINMKGGYYSNEDTLSTSMSSYKKLDNYFKEK